MSITQLPIGTQLRLTNDMQFNSKGEIVTVMERPAQWDEWGVPESIAADHSARDILGDNLPGPLALYDDSEYEVVELAA